MASTGQAVYWRSYNRVIDGKPETFLESVDRYVEGLRKLGLSEEACLNLHNQICNLKAFPSGRWMWVGGTPWLEKPANFIGSYNCVSRQIKTTKDLVSLADMAMMGAGTGADLSLIGTADPDQYCEEDYSIFRAVMRPLNVTTRGKPGTSEYREDDTVFCVVENTLTITVGDSRQGWVLAWWLLIEAAYGSHFPFNPGEPINVVIDLSNIRAQGERLKGFGGVANPVALAESFERMGAVLSGAVGRRLNTLEVTLLIDWSAMAIVAGNIRRCLPEHTLVHTDNSLVPIQDIKVGDLVQTPIGDRKVTAVFDQGEQLVYELLTNGPTIEATENHKMAVLSDSFGGHVWKTVSELEPEDQLIYLKLVPFGVSPITLGELTCYPVNFRGLGQTRIVKTYDIEVEEAHCFFANGYLTHNSAGMRQAAFGDPDFTGAKNNLWVQDDKGEWSVDPLRSALSMANHTMILKQEPIPEQITEMVKSQYASGEGAIQNAVVALWRANGPDLSHIWEKETTYRRKRLFRNWVKNLFFEAFYNGKLKEFLVENLLEEEIEAQINHRVNRWGLNPCFAAGTMVMTRDGSFPIETLVGKSVEVWDGSSWQPTEFKVTGENQPVNKLTLYSGEEIYATPYHTFILENGDRVEMKDLKQCDILFKAYERSADITTPIVLSVEFDHVADKVYCCTVESNHTFLLSNGLLVGQCGEIVGHNFACVAADTILVHKDGLGTIKELADNGQPIQIWNGEEWSEVTPIQTGSNRELFRVTLSDGTYLDVTANHKWVVNDRFRKNYQTVETKDLMAVSNYQIHTKPFTVEYDDDSAENLDYWYTLGFAFGDGSLDTKRNTICFQAYGSKRDVELASRYVNTYTNHLGTPYDYSEWKDDLGLFAKLRSLEQQNRDGLDWKPGLIEIFDKISSQSKPQILHFLAGWLDTDGCNTQSGGARLYLSGYFKAYLAKLLLMKCGIKSSLCLMAEKGAVTNMGQRMENVYYLSITRLGQLPCQRIDVSRSIEGKCKGKWQIIKSVKKLPGLHDTYCFDEPLLHQGVFGATLTKQCNLSEVHLNKHDPYDFQDQYQSFNTMGQSVATLLAHKFDDPVMQESREFDPIVGVSFTGLFDFFVNVFGRPWLEWWKDGRPEYASKESYSQFWLTELITNVSPLFDILPEDLDTDLILSEWEWLKENLYEYLETQHAFISNLLRTVESAYLTYWKYAARDGVNAHCYAKGFKCPNRYTTVQPSGSKSLLTGASPGWHPPKYSTYIRRITFGKDHPVALALMDYGFSVIPGQDSKDEYGNLLAPDQIHDPRCLSWLVEFPCRTPWAEANPDIDPFDFSALAQMDFYMQVQKYYATHTTSATIELTEEEIEPLAAMIYGLIYEREDYNSVAMLARSNAPFPRLPFERVSLEDYDRMVAEVAARRVSDDFTELMFRHHQGEESEPEAACSSGACEVRFNSAKS
jgi:hypothetical protein